MPPWLDDYFLEEPELMPLEDGLASSIHDQEPVVAVPQPSNALASDIQAEPNEPTKDNSDGENSSSILKDSDIQTSDENISLESPAQDVNPEMASLNETPPQQQTPQVPRASTNGPYASSESHQNKSFFTPYLSERKKRKVNQGIAPDLTPAKRTRLDAAKDEATLEAYSPTAPTTQPPAKRLDTSKRYASKVSVSKSITSKASAANEPRAKKSSPYVQPKHVREKYARHWRAKAKDPNYSVVFHEKAYWTDRQWLIQYLFERCGLLDKEDASAADEQVEHFNRTATPQLRAKFEAWMESERHRYAEYESGAQKDFSMNAKRKAREEATKAKKAAQAAAQASASTTVEDLHDTDAEGETDDEEF